MKNWPNNKSWQALSTEGLTVVDCGQLHLPSGRLVGCDPYVVMKPGGNPHFQIPPGSYSVKATLLDGEVAYMTVILDDNRKEVIRKVITQNIAGGVAIKNVEKEIVGFAVEQGTTCFVDDTASEKITASDKEKWKIEGPVANVTLPEQGDDVNIILFKAGQSDQAYTLVGGHSTDGRLMAIHIDFFLLGRL